MMLEDFDRERVSLGLFPTPLHRLSGLEKELDYSNIYIKRDDLTGVGIGGNKIRCMEYLLGHAIACGKDTILVSGAPQSNLCTLTACCCIKLNLKCIMILNGEKSGRACGNELLNEIIGADSIYIGNVDTETRAKYVDELCEKLEKEGKHPFIIKRGASTGYGAMGYVKAVCELYEQKKSTAPDLYDIFAPGGNGGVAAGLIFGNYVLGSPFRMNIISIEDSKKILSANIDQVISELEDITKIKFSACPQSSYRIIEGYEGEGWAINTPESEKEVFDFARRDGIFIENIFTSKVVVGMKDIIKKKDVKDGCCYLHTGGLGALFGQF